jgi:Asp-tRNA(Asn)/Glu-tRNA(Gln) amidotransferase A subunit family amidase
MASSESNDLLLAPATELARMVRERELAAVELLDLHAARIEERNGELNALVLPRLDQARGEALAADRALAGGAEVGPLHGVPFTCKEAIAVAGMRWPNGSRLFADAVAGYDAPAVRSMRAAGAILLGKTNVPEFCAFYDTANDLFGATRNPHAPERSAGGSSGGEAAAVASGMSALGIGSDLSSSIRNPAHFTGVFGLKPSREFGPCSGHAPDWETPLWSRLAVIGPLARSADDLELALTVLAGHPLPSPRPNPGSVAVYEDDFLQPVARDCRRAVQVAAEALADAGYETIEERPPRETEIRAEFNTLVAIEFAAPLAAMVAGREAELSRYGRMAIESASTGASLTEYLDAWTQLGILAREVDAWFEPRGLALCPVAPGPAPLIGEGFTEIDGEPVRPGAKLALCTIANGVGLPAASVPVLRTADGLPIGVQLIGGRGRDLEVIAAARTLEEACGGFIAPQASGARAER